MNRKLRKNHFFLKPLNVESEKLIVNLIGRHRVAYDDQIDRIFLKGYYRGGYKVTPDELILAFKYISLNTDLKCECSVRLVGDKEKEPRIIPGQYLDSVKSLAGWVTYISTEVVYSTGPKEDVVPVSPGVFPGNAPQPVRIQV